MYSTKIRTLTKIDFFEEGFELHDKLETIKVCWREIEEIQAYKVDLLTIDEIRFKICTKESRYVVSEKLKGFPLLIEALIKHFPSIRGWEEKIILPPFMENRTVLYYRKERINGK